MTTVQHQHRLTIASGQGAYNVVAVSSVDALRREIAALPDPRIIVDERVATLYPMLLADIVPEYIHRLPATEEEKTLTGVERIALFLQTTRASKRTTLVVIGGGITQDLGAFAAHIYYRGIPYLLIPTTLLSMADSCIGAKTGINFGAFKNQLGFFQSPAHVLIWNDFIYTLAPNDVRSGFGEILKLALTDGRDAFLRLQHRLAQHGFAVDGLVDIIFSSLRTKQCVIEADEYEADLRKILNYGHTFGHALEGITEHEIPHGLAVAWGVDVANYVAMRAGILDPAIFADIHETIARHFTLTLHHAYDATALVTAMSRDKKAAASSVQFVLLSDYGKLGLVPTLLDTKLESIVADYIRDYSILN